MSNKRETHKDHFDLLPFIAILMCVLGCLLLVTMSIAALSIGPGVGEGWVPTPNPKVAQKIPMLIEWDGSVATIHREGGGKVQVKWSAPYSLTFGGLSPSIPTAEAGSEELQKLLEELSQKKATHYALFAVRPSGFNNFYQFSYQFRSRNIDVGYEPIKQEKAVRLLKERKQQ
jgi:hypothetical protein